MQSYADLDTLSLECEKIQIKGISYYRKSMIKSKWTKTKGISNGGPGAVKVPFNKCIKSTNWLKENEWKRGFTGAKRSITEKS